MQQDQLVSTIEQHLLNTLNNNTAIRQESEKKLFETQTASEFPLFLLQIMRKNENNSNMLDLIASTYFVTYLRNKFKYQNAYCFISNTITKEDYQRSNDFPLIVTSLQH